MAFAQFCDITGSDIDSTDEIYGLAVASMIFNNTDDSISLFIDATIRKP
jgi:hypothetical protein